MTRKPLSLVAFVLAATAGFAAAELPPALMAPFDPQPAPETDQLAVERATRQRIANARAEADRDNKWVLLEFTARWCEDCQEVARVAALAGPAAVIARRYVRVPIDVGDTFDHSTTLTDHFDVRALSHWVVIDARGRRVAAVTLQPRYHQLVLTPEAFSGWLEDPSDIPPPMRRDAAIPLPLHAPTREGRRSVGSTEHTVTERPTEPVPPAAPNP